MTLGRGGRITRRTLLAGVAAAAVVGVRPPERLTESASAVTGYAEFPEYPELDPAVVGALPARADVVARYAPRRPTDWGLAVPGVVTELGAEAIPGKAVALTFDACGGPHRTDAGCGVDAALIATLRRYDARATLFLNSRWIAANPKVFDDLAADPRFEIANHGTVHMPLSVTGRSAYGEPGTRSPAEVYDEVAGNHVALARRLGRAPRWFRPGTAHCDEVAARLVTDLGERVIGFTVNGDAGTTFTPGQIVASLATAKAGDIVISHMNRPEHATAAGYALALPALLARGLRTVTLSEYLPPAPPPVAG